MNSDVVSDSLGFICDFIIMSSAELSSEDLEQCFEYDKERGQICIRPSEDDREARPVWSLERCPCGCSAKQLRNKFQMWSAI